MYTMLNWSLCTHMYAMQLPLSTTTFVRRHWLTASRLATVQQLCSVLPSPKLLLRFSLSLTPPSMTTASPTVSSPLFPKPGTWRKRSRQLLLMNHPLWRRNKPQVSTQPLGHCLLETCFWSPARMQFRRPRYLAIIVIIMHCACSVQLPWFI